MPKITFTVVSFHGFRFTVGPKRGEGGPMTVAECSAPWTERNRDAGGWDDLPETIAGGVKLIPAEFAAQHIEFIPANGMEKSAFSIDASSAEDFVCFVPTKDGEERELRFTIKTPATDAVHMLETFLRSLGEASGQLNITYAEEPKKKGKDEKQLALAPAGPSLVQEPPPLKGEALAEHQQRQGGKKKDVH